MGAEPKWSIHARHNGPDRPARDKLSVEAAREWIALCHHYDDGMYNVDGANRGAVTESPDDANDCDQ